MTDSEKLDFLINAMTGVTEEISKVKDEVSNIKDDVSNIKDEVSNIKDDVSNIKDEVSNIKKSVSDVEKKVTGIDLHLENVTDKNIVIIAEGHLDLSRKLDVALKSENEKEMLIIKMHILEDELRKVKERLEEIA